MVRVVDWQSKGCRFENFESCSLLLMRKALTNHLMNGLGLDKKWQLLMLLLKLALRHYTVRT